MKTWIGRILLAFAIFTLGYGLGRESGLARAAPGAPPTAAPGADKVLVYYLHTTFRCVTCNGIEKLARDTVAARFGAELATGRVEWQVANFQEREDLATRYAVSSSTVVVVKVRDGKEIAWQRLDEVWTLHERPEAFAEYIAGAVSTYLAETAP